MPVLYIHGVNTRTREGFVPIKQYLQRYVAPAISIDPKQVWIEQAYWGDVAAQFAWDGMSRPKSQLLGMGGAQASTPDLERALTVARFADIFAKLPSPSAVGHATGGLTSGTASSSAMGDAIRLKDLSPDSLSDLLATVIAGAITEDEERVRLTCAADIVALDPETLQRLSTANDARQEREMLLDRIREQVTAEEDELLAMGGAGEWFRKLGDRIGETASRAKDAPVYAASVVAAELRKPLNEFISVFIGDVFWYLRHRGDSSKPGDIPMRLMDKLRETHNNSRQRNNEPIVVLSHSMGGQIVYDAVTHFFPKNQTCGDLRIDFWCATASQVGFFEEIKLFIEQDEAFKKGNPVPFPSSNLGGWWNLWDHNDFLSFSVKNIVNGVDDEGYNSGMSLLSAHGGYLQRPSFYRAFAQKLSDAKANNWNRP